MVPQALLVTALVLLAGAVNGENLVCTSSFEKIISSDCKTLYRCVWGKPVRMPDCSPGLIYSRQFGVCVYEGSEFDDCETKKGKKKILLSITLTRSRKFSLKRRDLLFEEFKLIFHLILFKFYSKEIIKYYTSYM